MSQIEIFPDYEEYLQPARMKVAYGGRGSAKCLGRGTKVIMADASLKAIEDVRQGEKLLSPDGSLRTVLSVARGVGPLYQVTQKTGMSYVVNDAHILVLERSQSCVTDYGSISKAGNRQRPNGRYAGYDTGKGYSLITAAEYSSKPERFKSQHFGFRRAIAGVHKDNLPVDPYLLGAWLGDGSSKAPEITTVDFEMQNYLHQIADSNGWTVKARSLDKAPVFYLGQNYERGGSFTQQLRVAGVWKNKHIPEIYFGASADQRRALLAGLVDTDGHVANGNIEISQSVERMTDDIIRLAHGLGFKASKKQTNPVCGNNGKVCRAWKTHIGGDIDTLPLIIQRKKEAASKLSKNKDWRRTRIDVEPIGEGEYFGFELDGDHLFMLSDGTVTHNTRTFVTILLSNVLHYGWRVVAFRELMESIEDSVYQEVVAEIDRRGWGQWFTILKTEIRCPISGGVFKFSGIKSSAKRLNSQKLKGFSDFDAAWLEEANPVSVESWNALIPTMRKGDSEIWVSFNPENPLEETYKRFVTERKYPDYLNGRRYCIVKKLNFDANPRFPQELRDDMELMKANDFEMYRHVYLGEPVSNSELSIIKPIWIEAAMDAHLHIEDFPMGGGKIGGFDVSGGVEGDIATPKSNDPNAFAWRHGCILQSLEEWHDEDPNRAAATCYEHAYRAQVDTLNIDDIGVGASVPGELRRLQNEAYAKSIKLKQINFHGWTASEGPQDPDAEYMPGKTNFDMFANLKAQGWGMLSDRFRATWQARNGLPYNKDKLISLPSGLPMVDKLKAELAQPRREIINGRFKVEGKKKLKERGIPSHNLADAVVMAYAPGDSFDLSALL